MSTRVFRVGEGRTLHLPLGLVEGAGYTRVSAPDVEHRRWAGNERVLETGVHADVVELEVARIASVPGAARFVSTRIAAGDLVELTRTELESYRAARAVPAPAKTERKGRELAATPSKEPTP